MVEIVTSLVVSYVHLPSTINFNNDFQPELLCINVCISTTDVKNDFQFDFLYINICISKRGFQVDVFAEIYPCVLPGLAEKESIMDKCGLCRRALCAVESIVDATCTKTLKFKNHAPIADSCHKLIAIYSPMKHFAECFLPGYEISRSHETTPFSMNYREYWQRELSFAFEWHILDWYWI